MDDRSRNPRKIMETTAPFDLNTALQLWLEHFGQSSEVKAEDLTELESHIRDSVNQLQGKGLTSEESFLIATHRVGTPAKLEPEFAKINRSPLNTIVHGIILVFFSISCWFLWGITHIPQMMAGASVRQGRSLPQFSQFVMESGAWLVVPPVLAAIYCVCVWTQKSRRQNSWAGFFATTMAVLILLALPIVVGAMLPMVDFINHFQ